ncbi:MAG: hypothetical protein AAF958_13555 [Planctomycetota bacterium]
MSPIEKCIRAARTRLTLGRFGRALAISSFVGLIVATLAVLLPAVRPMEIDHAAWNQGWMIASAAGAVLAAIVYTAIVAPTSQSVAQEIDKRFGLHERLGSTQMLNGDHESPEFAAALREDAARRAAEIKVSDEFALRPSPIVWLPLAVIPVLVVVLLALGPASRTPIDADDEQTAMEIRQVKSVTKQLRKRIEQQKRKAEAKGLDDAKDMFEKLENKLDRMAARKDLNQKQAMIELNDLKKQLEERRKSLGSSEEMRKMMAGMKDIQAGPGDKVSKAIQQGDFGKAEKMMQQLAKQLRDGKLDEQKKEQLKKQVEQMAKSLKKAVEQQQKKEEELKKQIEKAKQEGRQADAEKMQQKLNDMQSKNQQQMGQMKKMAEAMQNAAQSMKSGDASEAADAMQQMADQLGDLQEEMEQLEDLEATLGDLDQSKQQMRCKQCQGDGCKGCQGMGQGMGDRPGEGMGRGTGKGDRPEAKDDTNTYETQVRGKVKRGRAIISGFADGPNRKGVTRQAVREAIGSAMSEESDPAENQNLPRTEREHAQQYFDQLRDN